MSAGSGRSFGDARRVRVLDSKLPGAYLFHIHTAAKITGTSVRMIEQHYGKLLQDDSRERPSRIAFA